VLPYGFDPAELYQQAGPDALASALQDRVIPLARTLINQRMAFFLDRLHEFEARGIHDVEDRVFAARRAAEVIAALPEDQWYTLAMHVAERTGRSATDLPEEITAAIHTLGTRPSGGPQPRPGGPPPRTPTNIAPTERWATLAQSINPQLTNDSHSLALPNTIERAAANGTPVAELLPALANDPPSPDRFRAGSLEFRLIDAAGDTIKPLRRKDDPITTTPAADRRTAADAHAKTTRADAGARPAADDAGPSRPPSIPPRTPPRPAPAPRR
jgi:DNA primase